MDSNWIEVFLHRLVKRYDDAILLLKGRSSSKEQHELHTLSYKNKVMILCTRHKKIERYEFGWWYEKKIWLIRKSALSVCFYVLRPKRHSFSINSKRRRRQSTVWTFHILSVLWVCGWFLIRNMQLCVFFSTLV